MCIRDRTNVEGPGIIITLSDNSSSVMAEDLIKLMNELKAAEAEANHVATEIRRGY